MFWDSVITGLSVLLHWQTYVAAGLFLVISMLPMLLVGAIAMRSEHAGMLAGFLSIFVNPFFQAFALVVFVLTLSPILLGLSNDAAWLFPWAVAVQAPWWLAKLIGILTIAGVVLRLLPILGQSFYTLLLGSFTLSPIVDVIESSREKVATTSIQFWPGFWFVAGLVIIGSAMAWIGTICAALLFSALEARSERLAGLGQLLSFPLTAVFGFIPLFIYAAWIGNQL